MMSKEDNSYIERLKSVRTHVAFLSKIVGEA